MFYVRLWTVPLPAAGSLRAGQHFRGDGRHLHVLHPAFSPVRPRPYHADESKLLTCTPPSKTDKLSVFPVYMYVGMITYLSSQTQLSAEDHEYGCADYQQIIVSNYAVLERKVFK